MREFSTVDLLRNLKTVTHAASREPVAITQHRKARFVLMAVEDFENLTKIPKDSRRAFYSHETPPELRETLLSGLDDIITAKADDER